MEATPKIEGTSMKVLAPYLPYGIEVEVRDIVREGHLILGTELIRGQLIGLTVDPLEREFRQKEEVAYSPYARRHLWRWAYPHMITPVLRPFSALCEPLADGTVPLVEVARMLAFFGKALEPRTIKPGVFTVEDDKGTDLIMRHMDDGDWALDVWAQIGGRRVHCQLANVCGVYDYLRSQHFALPVNGRPLVEGVDFIAKAGLPAIQEGSQPQAT